MSEAYTKTERLLEIEKLLLLHPGGLRQSELARLVGVNRSTIHRYLPELTSQFQVYETSDGRLAVDRENYLARLRITVHEAAAIFLAARLLHRHSDELNPHAADALHKLGIALQGVAPPMARGIASTADRMIRKQGRRTDCFVPALEALTNGWVYGRWVRVRYRRPGAKSDTKSLLAPYALDATGPGFSTYVLGLREPPGEVQVLKVERITSATVTDRPYDIPADLDMAGLFDSAWGVWRPGEEGPVEVVLRFAPRVAERIREARWHDTETAVVEADGSVLWRACIGDPTEIRPWIRSWGGDVEVLEPPELRRAIMEDVRAAWRLYGALDGGEGA